MEGKISTGWVTTGIFLCIDGKNNQTISPKLTTLNMQRIILIIIGWLAVVLGTLGVVLPVLPTTPFILLAAWCFARSSPRFHAWLLYRSWFGSYLRFWQKHHAMPRGVKPRAILLILLTFAISLWFVQMPWVRIMLLVILACLLFYMWRIPVIDEKQEKH